MLGNIKTQRIGCFERTSPPVFLISAGVMLTLILLCTLYTEWSESFFQAVQKTISFHFSWVFTGTTSFFLIFVLALAFSRYGKIRLGDSGDEPDFDGLTWFAMLFSAGMGIGLVFWSIAEPITHYVKPPVGKGESLFSEELAMRFTYFHWGFHAWAVFMVVALSLSYFSYRKGLPLTIRSAFFPILGKKIFGPIGHAIDIFAVVGTMFGVSTSLGLGVMQVNSGLNFLMGLPETDWVQVILIISITAIAAVSVGLGLEKGISRLSQLNLVLAGFLLLFVLLLGPTAYVLQNFFHSVEDYFMSIPLLSFMGEKISESDWRSSWTTFYWAWWISWAPFVGVFIARISRGRTIRELILTGLLGPALATFFWISIFGGTALNFEIVRGEPISEAVFSNVGTALFVTLERLPYHGILATLSIFVIVVFFVTSSDSGSLVIDMLTAGGDPNPPAIQRIFWAIVEGGVAIALLMAGGLGTLQTAAIASGFPLALLLVAMCFSLTKALRKEFSTSFSPLKNG